MQVLNKKVVVSSLIGIVAGSLLVYSIANLLTDNRLAHLKSHTKEVLAEQQTLLVAIAETTARNGADSVTEEVVRDCPLTERNEFDSLLSRLNQGLSMSELNTLERLFGRCGSFYAERKAVMVARLSREIEVYDEYVQQLAFITGDEVSEEYNVAGWQTLVAEEQKQSQLFDRLVLLQEEIIASLLEGNNPNSEEMQTILHEVREAQETLVVANKQAGDMRSELIAL